MRTRPTIALLCTVLLGSACLPFGALHAQGASPQGQSAEGKRVYQKANCIGCHKWHGGGGGGYGGDALSLRATSLDRDQIIETIACGRPGTGMPYFRRGAYDDGSHPCYGMSRQDAGKDIPVEAGTFLRPNEIAAVTGYVLADIKGKGDPSYADCAAFFGDGARVCNVYKTAQPTQDAAPPGKQGG